MTWCLGILNTYTYMYRYTYMYTSIDYTMFTCAYISISTMAAPMTAMLRA